MDDLEAMARNFYGFGRWSAPYWFIGLEQGGGDNASRAKAFKVLQSDGLCDCQNFHQEINVTDWHSKSARLQKTWGRLIMLLAPFRGIASDKASLLSYQRQYWGRQASDTCVIELSGLSAAGLHIKVDRKKYLTERIDTIRRKLNANNPRLVVMYGLTGTEHFEQIAECELLEGGIVQNRKTFFVLTQHPTRQISGNSDDAWRQLGTRAHARLSTIQSRCESGDLVKQGVNERISNNAEDRRSSPALR